MSVPRPETLAKRLFRARLRERLPHFEELKGVQRSSDGLVFAWRARKRFICYISMQLDHRGKPGFTIEVGWSRGEVASFFMLGSLRRKGHGDRTRLGFLMEPPHDRWWWLCPDELTLPQQVAAARSVPTKKQLARAQARETFRKEVVDPVADPGLRAVLTASIEKSADRQLRIDAMATESPDDIAARVRARVDHAVEELIAHGLPWLAHCATKQRTSLPGIAPPPPETIPPPPPPRPFNPIMVWAPTVRERMRSRLPQFGYIGQIGGGTVFMWQLSRKFIGYLRWRWARDPARFTVDVGWTQDVRDLSNPENDPNRGERATMEELAPSVNDGWFTLASRAKRESEAVITKRVVRRVNEAIDAVTKAGLPWLHARASVRGIRLPA